MNTYAKLHCLSNFTFLRGASRPEDLVERAYSIPLSHPWERGGGEGRS